MRVGVPKEIKKNEHRVGLTPTAVREYVAHGHTVSVQTGAGLGAGFTDQDFNRAGAKIVPTAAEIFAENDMIVKVKEPQKVEWEMLREDQILFTYLHLAPDPEQTKGLIASKCAAVAYETVTDARGGLPLLAPMSEVAGRIAVFSAAETLLKHNGRGPGPGAGPGRRRRRPELGPHGRRPGRRGGGDGTLHPAHGLYRRSHRRPGHHPLFLDRRDRRGTGQGRRHHRCCSGARCRGSQADQA